MNTPSKIKIIGKASTPNKPYTALGCKQHYSKFKKAITPNPGMVNKDPTMLTSMDKMGLRNNNINNKGGPKPLKT